MGRAQAVAADSWSAAEPSTPTEHLLVDMWADLLALECVGIHDNFFARGGHSLLIVRMAARLQARCQCEVTPRDVFHSPTIAQLAALLDAKMTTLKE